MKKQNYNFDNIPKELCSLNQWVLHRAKRPFQPNGKPASTTDRSTWASFEGVLTEYDLIGGFDGIGFAFSSDDDYCGIDFDHCVNPKTKEIEPWALKWLEQFSVSYIEYSLSGTGIHVITKAKLPGNGRRKGQIEIYDQGRYFTITGNIYGGLKKQIQNQQDVVDELLKEISSKTSTNLNRDTPLQGNEITEDEIDLIIKKAGEASNGEKFRKLLNGNFGDYPSQSEADSALCAILAFYANSNEIAIDQIFRKSKLYRSKWDRPDYRTNTIKNAVAYFKESKIENDFQPLSPSQTEITSEPFPIIQIAKVESKKIEYLIEDLWAMSSVGFISGRPGNFKTWVSLDFGLSVATGTKALGYFQCKQGKVIAFNAEDDPSTNTRQRLSALAASKGVKLESADFHLLQVHSLHIDEESVIKRLETTIALHKPTLVILDPFVGLHTKDENSASDISPILENLRLLNRKYNCSILLVCHDRKNTKGDREAQTRGTSAIHGWRDAAIYLNKNDKLDGLISIYVQHRGAPSVPTFHFSVNINQTEDKQIKSASLLRLSNQEIPLYKDFDLENEIKKVLVGGVLKKRREIRAIIGKRKEDVGNTLKAMLEAGELKEIKRGKERFIQFPEPFGTETSAVGSGSSPYKGEPETTGNERK